MILDSKTV